MFLIFKNIENSCSVWWVDHPPSLFSVQNKFYNPLRWDTLLIQRWPTLPYIFLKIYYYHTGRSETPLTRWNADVFLCGARLVSEKKSVIWVYVFMFVWMYSCMHVYVYLHNMCICVSVNVYTVCICLFTLVCVVDYIHHRNSPLASTISHLSQH